MAVFGKDSEVYDAVQELRAAVKVLEDETGLTKKKEAEAKAAEEAAAKQAEDDAKEKDEAGKQAAVPGPAPTTRETVASAPKETAATQATAAKK